MARHSRREQSGMSESERAYLSGLRLLSYRSRTRLEMRQRLGKRFSAEAVEEATSRLEEMGYLNDASFARSWKEGREARKPRSATLIRHELRHKGVSKDLAESVTAGMDDETSAYEAGRRHLNTLRGVDKRTFRRRMGNYLRRRGFATGLVIRTVDKLWPERSL